MSIPQPAAAWFRNLFSPNWAVFPVLTADFRAGYYAAYLNVWERDIIALDDPLIREVALGGPDTATRTKTVWQARLLRLGDLSTQPSCPSDFQSLFPSGTGELKAQAQPGGTSSDPCSIPAQAGYRRLENQLYRVEIHKAGKAGAATFKWSRDNGSVIAAWSGQDPANSNNLFVSTLGKDQVLGFAAGQWVELTDDTRELWGLPGTLVQLASAQTQAQGPTLTINPGTATGSTTFSDFPLNPKVRRWDMPSSQQGPATMQEGTWLDLESGVQVWFQSGGTYHTGDYWLIPARTATAISSPQVEWPADNSGNPVPQKSPAAHYYCGLALLSFSPVTGWIPVCDCRPVFSPLAHPPCLHVTDVRTVNPDATLLNDSVVNFANVAGGLKIVCDGAIDPASIKLPTCFVSIDYPLSGANSSSWLPDVYVAALPVTIAASVTTSGNSIYWFPLQQAVSWLWEQLTTLAAQTEAHGTVLFRLTLKGSFIWSQGCTSITLDGETLAMPRRDASGNLFSALQLPSGDGRPGGNFESWFWVPGNCDKTFPANYIPFEQITSIAGPDATGDRVVVGYMTIASYQQMAKLQVPNVTAREIYCSPVEIAPGTWVYAYVPIVAEREGNFSTFGSPLINPQSGAAFPGNIIPASEIPSVPASQTKGLNVGVFAWRVRSIYPAYGYYGYYAFEGIGAELI